MRPTTRRSSNWCKPATADAQAAQAAAGGAATDADNSASASKAADDDNVVDAEVKEVKKG